MGVAPALKKTMGASYDIVAICATLRLDLRAYPDYPKPMAGL
jgi:hypothetical protein